MKNIIKIMTILFVLTSSCQKEVIQDCEGDNASQVETFFTDEFESTPCGLQNIEGNEKETYLVISTQADYEKYFICSTKLPAIDFEKYFILAGHYQHHQCAKFVGQQVLFCNNKIIYRVRMLELDCLTITSVYYVTVIEKEYKNLPVEFDVKFTN